MATVACDIGDLVELAALFDDGATPPIPKDPTAVTLQVKDPTGATVAGTTPTHGGTGVYTYNLPITASGIWHYRFAGTGAVVAAEEAKVFARESAF